MNPVDEAKFPVPEASSSANHSKKVRILNKKILKEMINLIEFQRLFVGLVSKLQIVLVLISVVDIKDANKEHKHKFYLFPVFKLSQSMHYLKTNKT